MTGLELDGITMVHQVYVKGFSSDVTPADLRSLFSDIGPINILVCNTWLDLDVGSDDFRKKV